MSRVEFMVGEINIGEPEPEEDGFNVKIRVVGNRPGFNTKSTATLVLTEYDVVNLIKALKALSV